MHNYFQEITHDDRSLRCDHEQRHSACQTLVGGPCRLTWRKHVLTRSELTDMACGAPAASCPAMDDDPSAKSHVSTCAMPLSCPSAGRRPLLVAAPGVTPRVTRGNWRFVIHAITAE